MKAIEKPSQTALAAALGIDPAMVTRYGRKGMPLHSIEAAQAWRSANVRVRMTPETDASATGRALEGEQAAARAGALLQAAGELLEHGGDVGPMVATIRQAMSAVPGEQRGRVLFPANIMDWLTEDVAKVVKKGDPSGLLYGNLVQGRRPRGEAVDMGAFWYAVAAGEIRAKRLTG
jgi:hypothetical protein